MAKNSNVLFVSVKPQYVHQVLSEARDSLSDGTLVISIAAGITGEGVWAWRACSPRIAQPCPASPSCRLCLTAAAAACALPAARAVLPPPPQWRSCWMQPGPMHACAG